MRAFTAQTKIERLPPQLGGKLRSQTAITGLARIVEELVCNSIDARASKIIVELDSRLLSLRVEDDGIGIPQDSFSLLCQRSCSSKLQAGGQLSSVATLGFRGEALASVADSSILEVISRATGSFETHIKALRGGEVLKHGLALEQRRHHGTVVSVRDFLYNQPVRRKQLAQAGAAKEMEKSRNLMFRLALPHPHISFHLMDRTQGKTVLFLRKDRALKETLPMVFGKDLSALKPVQASLHGMRLEGFTLQPPSGGASKSQQLLYLNRRPVQPGPVLKLITELFHEVVRKLEKRERPGSRQQANSNPAFLLQLECERSLYDITYEADKSLAVLGDWAPAVALVRSGILQAWRGILPASLATEVMQPSTDVAASKQHADEFQQRRLHQPLFPKQSASSAEGGRGLFQLSQSVVHESELHGEEAGHAAPAVHGRAGMENLTPAEIDEPKRFVHLDEKIGAQGGIRVSREQGLVGLHPGSDMLCNQRLGAQPGSQEGQAAFFPESVRHHHAAQTGVSQGSRSAPAVGGHPYHRHFNSNTSLPDRHSAPACSYRQPALPLLYFNDQTQSPEPGLSAAHMSQQKAYPATKRQHIKRLSTAAMSAIYTGFNQDKTAGFFEGRQRYGTATSEQVAGDAEENLVPSSELQQNIYSISKCSRDQCHASTTSESENSSSPVHADMDVQNSHQQHTDHQPGDQRYLRQNCQLPSRPPWHAQLHQNVSQSSGLTRSRVKRTSNIKLTARPARHA
ncbi:hypothetical protein WJX74_004151 [Apatococcus lobatus]|uniref:DNA mismatch repair protein S5 domain-containing protein n=1 Tax=Apatococcus lobatus TaxID=904363 RepID=A0AAW1RZT4_9CHLO